MKKDGNILYFLTLCLIFILCAVVSKFFFQMALIEGKSMEPTYHSRQLVLINKTDKSFNTGDAVMFYCEGLESTLVKRIAACSGDRVLIKDGTLFVNEQPANCCNGIEYSGIAGEELTVPLGCYFVLGDNLNESVDSRYDAVGFVSFTDIEGKVMQR